MNQTEEALARAERRLKRTKVVSLGCVFGLLLVVNTNFLPSDIRYAAAAAFLDIGFVSFIIGIRYTLAIPRLERLALRESGKASLPNE